MNVDSGEVLVMNIDSGRVLVAKSNVEVGLRITQEVVVTSTKLIDIEVSGLVVDDIGIDDNIPPLSYMFVLSPIIVEVSVARPAISIFYIQGIKRGLKFQI